jgi:hypothetical protein
MPPIRPEATVNIIPTPPPPGPPRPAAANPLTDTAHVLEITSTEANGSQAARLTNLGQSNVIANFDRGAQNAVANQQAHAGLAVSVLGKTVNRVQNLGPLEARSSVDVFTGNEVAQAIGDLQASLAAFSQGQPIPVPPHRWPRLLREMLRLLAELERTRRVNDNLGGDGTLATPFTLADRQPLFASGPASFGFVGWPPDRLTLEVLRQLFTPAR